jgi:hypothetical protein
LIKTGGIAYNGEEEEDESFRSCKKVGYDRELNVVHP